MINLGKLPNGVALFSEKEKTKIVIQSDRHDNILVSFDTAEYDKTNNDGEWAIKDIDILRKDNKEICKALDMLYDSYFTMIKENPNQFIFRDSLSPNNELRLYKAIGDKYELLYPSEDEAIEDSTMLGITKFDELGYMLTFHKSSKNINKKSILIRNQGSRIPELFPLYNQCFASIAALANTDFIVANRLFYEAVSTEPFTDKQLKLLK